jgi:hypothetical protein
MDNSILDALAADAEAMAIAPRLAQTCKYLWEAWISGKHARRALMYALDIDSLPNPKYEHSREYDPLNDRARTDWMFQYTVRPNFGQIYSISSWHVYDEDRDDIRNYLVMTKRDPFNGVVVCCEAEGDGQSIARAVQLLRMHVRYRPTTVVGLLRMAHDLMTAGPRSTLQRALHTGYSITFEYVRPGDVAPTMPAVRVYSCVEMEREGKPVVGVAVLETRLRRTGFRARAVSNADSAAGLAYVAANMNEISAYMLSPTLDIAAFLPDFVAVLGLGAS